MALRDKKREIKREKEWVQVLSMERSLTLPKVGFGDLHSLTAILVEEENKQARSGAYNAVVITIY